MNIDIVEFERDMNALIIKHHQQQQQQPQSAQQDLAQDLAKAILSAVLSKFNKGSAIHMHLRLKHGANVRTHAMSRHELADLVEIVASDDAIANRLANFYVRIAMLRARIEEIKSTMSGMDLAHNGVDIHAIQPQTGDMTRLLAAYAKNEEKRREKQNENQRELARIMESSWNPDLTEDDLPALETRVAHIAERGFAAEEMRRLKIVEAALEEQRFHQLKMGACA